jgi:hypothetical protein
VRRAALPPVGTLVAQPVPDDQLPRFFADLLRQGALARLVELHIGKPVFFPARRRKSAGSGEVRDWSPSADDRRRKIVDCCRS